MDDGRTRRRREWDVLLLVAIGVPVIADPGPIPAIGPGMSPGH